WLVAALLATAIALGSASALELSLPDWLDQLWWGALLALGVLALLDALWLRRLPSPRVERLLPGKLPLGRWSEVQLTLHHDFRRAQRVQVFDHVPADMELEHLPQQTELQPGGYSQLGYRVRPLKRGHFHFLRCELLLDSPLRLWQGRRFIAQQDDTRVYPD